MHRQFKVRIQVVVLELDLRRRDGTHRDNVLVRERVYKVGKDLHCLLGGTETLEEERERARGVEKVFKVLPDQSVRRAIGEA